MHLEVRSKCSALLNWLDLNHFEHLSYIHIFPIYLKDVLTSKYLSELNFFTELKICH